MPETAETTSPSMAMARFEYFHCDSTDVRGGLTQESLAHVGHGREFERLPVREGGLPGQAAGVAQELTHGELGLAVLALTPDLEPRQVGRHGIIELERARVPQLHDGGGGEELGHKAYAIAGGGRGRDPALDVGMAEGARPEQLLIVHHGHRDARERQVRETVFDPRREQIEGGPQLWMPGAGARRLSHG